MVCYVYDGSFMGLLTAIYEAYYRRERLEEIFAEDEFKPSFFYEPVYINNEKEKYLKVYNAIEKKISKDALRIIYYVFLSEVEGTSTLIYRYIKMGFKIGKDVDLHLHNEVVISMHRMCKKVMDEKHRMLGFLRFRQLRNGVYYAAMEPDHNILQLITPHFAKRLSGEQFMIHDRKREIVSLYKDEKWVIAPLSIEQGDNILKCTGDSVYENLWKQYFKSANIENRRNLRLQKRSMPKRYWKYIIETEDSLL